MQYNKKDLKGAASRARLWWGKGVQCVKNIVLKVLSYWRIMLLIGFFSTIKYFLWWQFLLLYILIESILIYSIRHQLWHFSIRPAVDRIHTILYGKALYKENWAPGEWERRKAQGIKILMPWQKNFWKRSGTKWWKKQEESPPQVGEK